MLDDTNRKAGMYSRSVSRSLILIMAMVLSTGCASLKDGSTMDPVEVSDAAPSISDILAEADKALGEGDIDTAQISYALAIERDPENVEALYKLGYVHSRKGSPVVAISLLRHALQVDAQHQQSRQLLGNVLLEMEEYADAEKAFDEILGTDASAWRSLNGLGVIRDLQARHEEAQQYFERAVALQPRSAKVTNNLGYSHYLSGDYAAAEQLFLEAIEFDNAYERAWANLALLYSREGRIRDSSAAFRKIVTDSQAANNVGYLGMLQGNGALAREQLTRAVQLAPSYYELANRNLEGLSSLLEQLSVAVQGESITAEVGTTQTVASTDFSRLKVPVAKQATLTAENESVMQVQGALQFLDYEPGLVDGKMGASTRQAIKNFQRHHKLKVDGKIGRVTKRVLQRETARSVQGTLHSLGFDVALIDGKFGANTRQAVRLFQRQNGLAETGNIDNEVLVKLVKTRDLVRQQLNSARYLDTTSRG